MHEKKVIQLQRVRVRKILSLGFLLSMIHFLYQYKRNISFFSAVGNLVKMY